ncbi:hypothetical protein ACFL57_04745 [Candidatus Margulisiibacteriota bacterium]
MKSIKISEDDLKTIFGSEWDLFLEKIIPNVFCNRCNQPNNNTTIIDYTAELNDLNDVILKGKCVKCHSPVARYVETGEMPQCKRAIAKVRKKYGKR